MYEDYGPWCGPWMDQQTSSSLIKICLIPPEHVKGAKESTAERPRGILTKGKKIGPGTAAKACWNSDSAMKLSEH